MRVADFDFILPPELIAQSPSPQRDASRLLVLNRQHRSLEHHSFHHLPDLLHPGDLLVVNNSKVVPARMRAHKPGSNSSMEVFLTEELSPQEWWTMLRPAKRVQVGGQLNLLKRDGTASKIRATVREKTPEGLCRLAFDGTPRLLDELDILGEVPLPPYIARPHGPTKLDHERYQVIYAQTPGSVAAPTAGLHFTTTLLQRLRQREIEIQAVTLHVGLGTFAPVKVDRPEDHALHAERYEISRQTAEAITNARTAGRRIVAVGTTTVRALEHAAGADGSIRAGAGATRLFIYPPRRFRVVGALVTNFHLPRSSLLMLVAAFVSPGAVDGLPTLMQAYRIALAARYRFYSYGDAMLIR